VADEDRHALFDRDGSALLDESALAGARFPRDEHHAAAATDRSRHEICEQFTFLRAPYVR